MIFKISSFLTLSLTLSCLDAVAAISLPDSVHDGQLKKRAFDDFDVVTVKAFPLLSEVVE